MVPAAGDAAPVPDRVSVLLGTYLFQDLSPAEVEPLARTAEVLRFGRGAHIFDIGDRADRLYVVVSGETRDSVVTEDGDEFMYAMWGPGMVVGEPGFFSPEKTRVLAFIAVAPTTVLALAHEHVMPFLLRHPPAMVRALEGLASLARSLSVQVATDNLQALRERLLLRLLDLADTNPQRRDASAVTPKVTQSMLSAMVGVSRENVNRALASLIASGLVRAEGGQYVVVDRARAWREVTSGSPELERPNRRTAPPPG